MPYIRVIGLLNKRKHLLQLNKLLLEEKKIQINFTLAVPKDERERRLATIKIQMGLRNGISNISSATTFLFHRFLGHQFNNGNKCFQSLMHLDSNYLSLKRRWLLEIICESLGTDVGMHFEHYCNAKNTFLIVFV